VVGLDHGVGPEALAVDLERQGATSAKRTHMPVVSMGQRNTF
jgi:hypothetical protein